VGVLEQRVFEMVSSPAVQQRSWVGGGGMTGWGFVCMSDSELGDR